MKPNLNTTLLLKVVRSLAALAELKPYPGWTWGRGESDPGILLRIRRALWIRLKVPIVIKWLDGLRLYIYPGDQISRGIFLTGSYEPNQFFLLNGLLKEGMTFIDIGANTGLYTLFAAKKVGKQGIVLAIEPSNREFERLRENVKLNALTNVRFLQFAVSDHHKEAELLVATEERSAHNTLGAFAYDSVVLQTKERVSVEKLDDVVRKEELRHVDVIKMDIEGSEMSALQGAIGTLRQFHPLIILELSDRTLRYQGWSSQYVWQFLSENGYVIYGFDDNTGLPVQMQRKQYFDAENVIAVHSTYSGKEFWPY